MRLDFEDLDKTMEKDFTKNKAKKDRDQALEFAVEKDKYIKVSEDMNLSRSSISELVRLQKKLKFQEDRWVLLRMIEIMRFLMETTL